LSVVDVYSGAKFDEEPWVAIADDGIRKKVVAIGSAAKGATALVVNPFGHPRTLISDFTVAEELLKRVVRSLRTSWWHPSPTIVMHPCDRLEGGLTQVEIRAFKELVLGAGAGQVFFREGSELPLQMLRDGFKSAGLFSD
jgi:rod shape-determining protein MreB